MRKLPVPLFCALSAVLFCLLQNGPADAATSNGPVVGWGAIAAGQATPSHAVNVFGTATDIAAGSGHSCAL